jgi:hypothetical protein
MPARAQLDLGRMLASAPDLPSSRLGDLYRRPRWQPEGGPGRARLGEAARELCNTTGCHQRRR